MNLDQRKMSIVLILIYIICIAYTAYVLFSLQNDLIYSAQALVISELGKAQPIFIKLYLAIGATFLIGLGVLFYLFNNKGMEIIYVEKKDDEQKKKDTDKDSEDAKRTLDISSIHGALSSKAKSQEKIINDSLKEVCNVLEAGIGAFYMLKKDGSKNVLQMNGTYAMSLAESQRPTYELGEGLVGQVGLEKHSLIIDDIPEGYIKVVSGLGSASPTHILVSPVLYGNKVWGVVEIAAFTQFTKDHIEAVEKAFEMVTKKIFDKPKAEAKTTAKKEVKSTSKAAPNKKQNKKD